MNSPYEPEQVAAVYASTFSSRSDVYSIWTADGWRPRREPLTPAIVIAGLTGTGPAVSGYLIAPPGVSHVLAFDFDTDNGFEQGMALGRMMWKAGLPAYIETSRRGSHLWLVLDAVLDAVTIRKAGRALLAAALLPTDDPHIEIRPGSDTVTADGLGYALRLPTMPHPKTGQRGKVYGMPDEAGRMAALPSRVADMLLEIDLAPAAILTEWAGRWVSPILFIPTDLRHPFGTPASTHDSVVDVLVEHGPSPHQHVWPPRPGTAVICPLHDDHHPSLSIADDDQRAFCKNPSCRAYNDGRGLGADQLARELAHG